MEGGERDDRVEPGRLRLPAVEVRRHDLHTRKRRQVAPRDTGEIRAELDTGDLQPALRERDSRLTGPAADLEHTGAGLQASELDQVVEQLRRIAGPRAIVELGHLVERRAEPDPVLGQEHFALRILPVRVRAWQSSS